MTTKAVRRLTIAWLVLRGTALLALGLLLASASCTAEQRKNCAVCRFVSGEWVCPVDSNTPEAAKLEAVKP